EVEPGDRLDRAIVVLFMWRRDIAGLLGFGHGSDRAAHAQGSKDAGMDQIVPSSARSLPRRLTRSKKHQILILEAGSETLPRGNVRNPANQLVPAHTGPIPHQISPGQTGSVREQVANRNVLIRFRVRKM